MKIVSNTGPIAPEPRSSCLIILSKIGELELLHLLYDVASATLRDRISITPEIKREFGESLPEWIIVETVQDKQYQKILETKVDIGEASAMALAKENTDRITDFG